MTEPELDGQMFLFDDSEVPADESKVNDNPMVQAYGFGLRGKKCRTCKYLLVNQPGQNRYYKCELRGVTNGPGTDHRVGWNACSNYEEDTR